MIDLAPVTALDLILKGSTGSFKIGNATNSSSLEVKYFLTHVGLNFETGQDDRLLKELAPVREVFDFKSLDFDEIMQRDIDDARVSSELIPYILDEKSNGFIKFFPPIVVMVLPVENDNKPSKLYPKVKNYISNKQESGVENWRVTQSGDTGAEVFQFKQPILSNDEPSLHDLVTFSINTSKCKLVIVDGQHRAMALLAIYRNLRNGWSDARRQAFESYYKEWTNSYINQFNLTEIQLPMILCTVPSLDADFVGDFDLKKACRSIFLTLNKNARRVSNSRNLLLNDNDLVSSFMRIVLSEIKSEGRNFISETTLDIHCVELDQVNDRTKITSPIAITGVSHLYYMVEHLLLNQGEDDIKGVSPRSGRFASRTIFHDALDRLDSLNLLGKDSLSNIKRDIFSTDEQKELSESFKDKFGKIIFKTFSSFEPFKIHNDAANQLMQSLVSSGDIHLKPMLFDGQGIARVFEDHRQRLKTKLDEDYFKKDVPKIRAVLNELDGTHKRLGNVISEFEQNRVNQYTRSCSVSSGNKDKVFRLCDRWYKEIYSTVAFQNAIVCGFFHEIELAFTRANLYENGSENKVDYDVYFNEYLEQLNAFFKPRRWTDLIKLIGIFDGIVQTNDTNEINVIASSYAFREIVMTGEMQPDQWPKYKYLLIEIWKPSNLELNKQITESRIKCRKQVFADLHRSKKITYCREKDKSEENLNDVENDQIFESTYNSFKEFLKYFSNHSELNKAEYKKYI